MTVQMLLTSTATWVSEVMTTERILCLESISWSGPQLYIDITFDGVKFPTVLWYEFNLQELHDYYGAEAALRVYFHIAAFSLLKLTSLKPTVIEISEKLTRYYTPEFAELWKTCFQHIMGQWRYENDMANWKGPRFTCTLSTSAVIPSPAKIKSPQVFNSDADPVKSIACIGGGKDSLLATKLLEGAKVPFSSFSYSISRYGSAREQHDRAQRVLQHCQPTKRHWVMINDTFLDIPLDNDQWLKKHRVNKRSDAALTELFSILPIMMQYGYHYEVVGNEHSANVGNLEWEAEGGNPVNHQWEKSYEAERLFAGYINRVLVNIHYYSILQPIHDVLIFSLLRQYLEYVPHVHSCNLSPPWCKRCPKCCYVWLCFQAYLPRHVIDPMFNGENLLDVPENQLIFTQMLGLGELKPFECIGEFKEVQLAFELCRRKGLSGRAMETFEREFGPALDIAPILKAYTVVHKEHSIPSDVSQHVLVEMEKVGAQLRSEL